MLRLSTPNQERLLQARQLEVQFGGSAHPMRVRFSFFGSSHD